MPELVGREREMAAIEALLDRAHQGLSVLVLEGDPGIGKSALVAEACERAESRGMRVLRCQPVAVEASLAFASLTDLLGPLADEELADIPEPQRAALEAAILRRLEPTPLVLPRAVGAGLLTLLRQLAAGRPLMIAIDDAQWMDAASATTMGFALRRLEASPVGVIVASRPHAGGQQRRRLAELDRLPPHRIARVEPGPLSLSGTFHVLRSALGLRLPRPMLRRIHQASGGNPLLAIELARASDAPDSGTSADRPVPITDSIRSLMARRIGGQTRPARTAMLIIALLRAPTETLVRKADRRAADALDHLVTSSVVAYHGGVLRFAHPLLADVAMSWFGRDEVRAMHRRLARVASLPEERARHRALGLADPDAAAAAELTSAADAAARTSVEVGCELLELALAVTPASDSDEATERRLALARLRSRAGDAPGAMALLDELITSLSPGPTRARALEQRAQLEWVTGSSDVGVARCEEALGHPHLEGRLRARLLVTQARLSMDPEASLDRATAALAAIEQLAEPDPALLGEALVASAAAEFGLGRGINWATVERGLALEQAAAPEAVSDRMSAALGAWLKYAGDLDAARTWLRRTRDTAVAEGDEGSLPYALSHLPQLELWTGDWDAAYQAAHEHLAVAEWTGQEEQRLTAIYSLALVDAHAGRLDLARSRVLEALPDAERLDPWNVYQLLFTLGFVELTAGKPAVAVPHLLRAHELYEASGAGGAVPLYESLAEALVEAGDLARAASCVTTYVDRATRLNRPISLGPALRARALLEAAAGGLHAADRSIRSALEQHERVAMPFARARTLLAAGQIRRRLGQRRAARAALDEAKATFDRLGAPHWAARAEAELARIPMRRSRSRGELTATERQIADLVAGGMTNREVAAALFVTPKTVETNLTRVYAKLGVRSRSQLAARLHAPAEGHPEL